MPEIESGSIGAVVTDPPYSSGGTHAKDRAKAPMDKYISNENHHRYAARPFLLGDNRDQRSFTTWCTIWLLEAYRILRETGYILAFTDWRQLPAVSDAIQCAGFVWRGVIAWDKTEAARPPHTGYFRHQAEYVVWGTKWKCLRADGRGPFPGVIRERVDSANKKHPAQKPVGLMRQLVRCAPEGEAILDPFAGSGTTGEAAILEGRPFIGIEADPAWHQFANDRLLTAASA